MAFTGHRTYNGTANDLLRATISELYTEGARHFRVGMAEGFDLAAAEIVVELMASDGSILLEACKVNLLVFNNLILGYGYCLSSGSLAGLLLTILTGFAIAVALLCARSQHHGYT